MTGPVTPRPSSTVIVLRPTGDPFEILMVLRTRAVDFMAGAFVFPGGAIDDADDGDDARAVQVEPDPWRLAAARELAEEADVWITDVPVDADRGAEWRSLPCPDLYRVMRDAGIRFDTSAFEWLSNWVTPEHLPKRYDTRFYVVAVAATEDGTPDGSEVVELTWVSPREALERHRDGRWRVPLPTRKHLELLADLGSIGEALDFAAAEEPVPVQPKVALAEDGTVGVELPGRPGVVETP